MLYVRTQQQRTSGHYYISAFICPLKCLCSGIPKTLRLPKYIVEASHVLLVWFFVWCPCRRIRKRLPTVNTTILHLLRIHKYIPARLFSALYCVVLACMVGLNTTYCSTLSRRFWTFGLFVLHDDWIRSENDVKHRMGLFRAWSYCSILTRIMFKLGPWMPFVWTMCAWACRCLDVPPRRRRMFDYQLLYLHYEVGFLAK